MLADADSTYGEQEGSALTVIRLASPSTDAGAVAAIYRAAVESSVASFETDPPDASTMAGRMQRTLERTPWLVAVEGSPPIPDHWLRAASISSTDRATYPVVRCGNAHRPAAI